MCSTCSTPTYLRMEEVSKHKDQSSTWLVIHNAVYDVTTFLEQHPGGAEALLEYAGNDASQPFEDVGHSSAARNDLKNFKIGDLHPDDRIKKSCAASCPGRKDPSADRPPKITVPCPAHPVTPEEPIISPELWKKGLLVLLAGLLVGFIIKKMAR